MKVANISFFSIGVEPHFSRASPLNGETRFLCVEKKNHFKKKVWSRHLFLFYFKGEKQNKKEKNPKCDS